MTEHGIRPLIKQAIVEHRKHKIALTSSITVVVPFGDKERLSAVCVALADVGITSRNSLVKKKGKNKNETSKVAFVSHKYVQPHPSSGTVYELLPPADAELEEWQVASIAKQNPERDTIQVKTIADLLQAIFNGADVKGDEEAMDDDLAPPSPVELQLRGESEAAIEQLKEILDVATTPVVILLIAPQCIGKSTICTYLKSRGVVQASADIHMYADGQEFNPRRLQACHTSCQRDCLHALDEGKSVVVDNTNMQQAFRTIYQRIASALGAQIVPVVLAQDMWLTCDVATRQATLDVLSARARRRAKTGIGGTVTEDVIARTVGYGVNETKDCTADEWIANFPPPKPYPGMPLGCLPERSALMFRSEAVNAMAVAALADVRLKKYPGFSRGRVQCDIDRGIDEFHVTLMVRPAHIS